MHRLFCEKILFTSTSHNMRPCFLGDGWLQEGVIQNHEKDKWSASIGNGNGEHRDKKKNFTTRLEMRQDLTEANNSN